MATVVPLDTQIKYDGLNENRPPRLMNLNVWFQLMELFEKV